MAARGKTPGSLLVGILLACPCALALNPALDVSQYAHTAWNARDGFTKGEIQSIVQTPDGYLWLGTASGLFRFDGIKAVPWLPPKDQPLPSSDIRSLAVARDGTLWIGTRNGLASWKDGRLTPYAELAGLFIFALIEDQAGVIWVGAHGNSDGKFCEIRRGDVRCHPEMSHLGSGVMSLHEDGKGNLWVGLETGVWQWKPGPPRFFPVSVQRTGITSMADGDDGALLIPIIGAVGRLVDGKAQVAYPLPMVMRKARAYRILRDRDGGLWVATYRGIVHIHQGRTEVFSQSDGLTGDALEGIFEDREGSIWVATTNGLDRFRELPVVTYSTKQGWPNGLAGAVLAARDGSLWFNTAGGLNRLSRGQLTVYRGRHAPTDARAREIVVPGFQESTAAALFEDSRGRIWVSSVSRAGYLENDRFVSAAFPGGLIGTISEDSSGDIWTANQDLGLIEWSSSGRVEQIPWTTFGSKDPAPALVPDPVHGGVWLGFFRGGVAYFRDGQVRARYSAAGGLGAGRVNSLRWDGKGALWAATDGGLSRIKDGHIATLSSNNGLPCDAVHWAIEGDAESIWLGMPCGLVRVARSDLEAWAADADKAGGTIRATVFDTSDGVRNRAIAGAQSPLVAKSSDGKLWFPGLEGISMVDPRRLPFNKLAPPVQIEQITADRKTYAVAGARLRLPPLIRDLQIDYTALSLVAPEKVQFRYKLEGRDPAWIDAGTRRQAFYSDLPPGNYRFRVAASNNSGVWNEAGAFADFGVAPAYYQTVWFRASFLAALLALLAALYQLRLHYLKRQIHVRMEERVNERLRIARDLHDTLLQSFQAVLLKLQALGYLLPDRPAEAGTTLERVIEEARHAVTEGRDAVEGLRSSTVIANDLAQAMGRLGEELTADRKGQPCPEFRVEVLGKSRDLFPLVRDEVYRVAGEAVRNSFHHAHAGRIEVEIRYDQREFRLRVRDDGKGMDVKILEAGGRSGHHGLPGMQERAQLAGGKLTVWSEPEAGTEIELTIPGSLAYAKETGRLTMSAGDA